MTPDGRSGRRFGDYLVEEEIGRGGMGVVFRARNVVTGEAVALKLMAPDLAHSPTFRERFVREAEAGPSLDHPNIVEVYAIGEADGELYIAMQLIEGTDLKGLIAQEGRLDPKRVLSIFGQAASALDAAHESGMVHRDVKPQNILVIPRESPEHSDRIYLTDFGLVRPVAAESSASHTSQVFGSVAYMAPELIEGVPADGRADVYALGCVLYETLTGNVPFERDNEVSAVWAHIHEDPPLLTDACPDLPGGLNDVVLKAMAKHPEDRFLTCGEFVTELELGLGRKRSVLRYSHIRPLVARAPKRKTEREVWAPNFFPELSRVRGATRERLDWRKVVAFAAAIALLSTLQIGRDGGIRQAVVDAADAADSVADTVVDAVIEPEGQPVEVDRDVAKKGRARTQEGSGLPISSSDRKRLKRLLPAGNPTTPAEEGHASEAVTEVAPTYDGKIAWARANSDSPRGYAPSDIWVMDADGGNQVRLTATVETSESWPSWSPDGRYIAYVAKLEGYGAPLDLWVMNADGTDQRDLGLCPGIENCGKLAWSPDGRRVAYAQGSDLYVAELATGTSTRIVSGAASPVYPGSGPGPTWLPNGKSIAFSCGGALCAVPAEGGDYRKVAPELRDPEWSPAGNAVVGWYSPNAQGYEAYVVVHYLDGRSSTFITGASLPASMPSWSPDGRAIVYEEGGHVFRIDADSTDRVKLTSGSGNWTPDWGPSQ